MLKNMFSQVKSYFFSQVFLLFLKFNTLQFCVCLLYLKHQHTIYRLKKCATGARNKNMRKTTHKEEITKAITKEMKIMNVTGQYKWHICIQYRTTKLFCQFQFHIIYNDINIDDNDGHDNKEMII